MPYSPSHNYVHVAIPKTGSTSLVRALQNLHARDGGSLELYRGEVTSRFRRKHRLNELGDSRPGRAKHLSALQLKKILGVEQYESCVSFSIVRNPWARLASRYFYTHVENEPSPAEKRRRRTRRTFHDLSFDAWIERHWKARRGREYRNQVDKLTDLDGQVIVDFVGRLETFQESFDEICARLGVEKLPILHVNGTGKSHYSHYYSDRTKEIVKESVVQRTRPSLWISKRFA
jgi:hypothetical protein